MQFPRFMVMTTYKTCSFRLARLRDFQEELNTLATSHPGFLNSKTFIASEKNSDQSFPIPMHFVTINEWECEQDWRIWSGSEPSIKIHERNWFNPEQLSIETTKLNLVKENFPLL